MMFGIPSDLRLPDFPPMWSTTTTIPERATLTLLRGGQFVLGCPNDTSEDVREDALALVSGWLAGKPGLVLPFPVDVDDQREPA